ncbi:MAG: hypothetical protein ACRCY9_17625 [Phycicoccus sp.]
MSRVDRVGPARPSTAWVQRVERVERVERGRGDPSERTRRPLRAAPTSRSAPGRFGVVEVVIPKRFCGPPGSGNGGWVSGMLAGFLPAPSSPTRPERAAHVGGLAAVSVRLAAPPPLDRALTVVTDDDGGTHSSSASPSARLLDGATPVATATPSAFADGELPRPATAAEARAAADGWEGRSDHPFPTCLVCGTAREQDGGLGLRPGPLGDGSGRYATTWVPEEIDEPFVWAALDCPGGWSAGIAGRPMVLGTITAQVVAPPDSGEPYVVTAWSRGSRGRLHLAGTALHSADGRLLARAESVWVAVDPATLRATASRMTDAAPASALASTDAPGPAEAAGASPPDPAPGPGGPR